MSDIPTRPLTKAQIDHAKALLNKAHKDRAAALVAKHTTLGVKLNFAERQAALRAGRFVELPEPLGYDRTDIYKHVRFTDDRPTVVNDAGLSEEQGVLTKEYNRLLDELILGSASEALAAIRAFAATP